MAQTKYQSEFLNNLRVVGSVTESVDVNNASLQANTLGVSVRAVIQDVDVSNNMSVGGTLSVIGASTMAGVTMTSSTVTENASVGGTLSVTGASTMAGDLNVTGQSFLSETVIQGDAIVNGNTTLNGDVVIAGAFNNVLDKTYNVELLGETSEAVVVSLSSDYASGAFFMLVDESDFMYQISIPDGASAICSSCTNSNSSVVNRISGVDGSLTGRIDLSWATSEGDAILTLTINRVDGDVANHYFVVRILSPTRLFNPIP